MAFVGATEKNIRVEVLETQKSTLSVCNNIKLWDLCLRIPRIVNLRMVATRYIPILCVILIWHLMVTSRFHVKEDTQKPTLQTRESKILKFRDIITRLNKEKWNLMKEMSGLKSKPKGGRRKTPENIVERVTKAREAAASRGRKRLEARNEAAQIAKETALIDRLITDLKKQNIPSIETFRKNLSNEIYSLRIASIIREAASIDLLHDGGQHLATSGSDLLNKNYTDYKEMSLLGTNFVRRMESSHAVRQLQSSHLTEAPIEVPQTTNKHNYTLCNSVPSKLLGRVFVDFNHTHNMTRRDVLRQHPDLQFGGMWRPPNCVARHRVAIIIPYRDREQHLVTLLSHLLPILKRQELNFRIFVTEQTGNDTFNKARIMNAAFKEAIKLYDFQCFVFHDVDLIPEDDRNMYSCPVQPRHMSVAIDEMDYKVPYDYLVGGVLSMRTEHFQMVNGYSNLYWGWGAEDDDLAFRIIHVGLKITRPPSKVARYKMIKHEKRTPTDWKKRSRLLRTGVRRFNFDGLNSVNYNLISIKDTPLFTHILVDIGKPPSLT